MASKKFGKVCLKAMMRRVVESDERARGAQQLLKLERFDEANHLMQSASLLRHTDGESKKVKKAKPT